VRQVFALCTRGSNIMATMSFGGASGARPNPTQEQTGGLCRGSALPRLALLESMCQRRSEDFVPPAAQRKAVSRTVGACRE